MNLSRLLSILLFSFMLVACGGSGGEDSQPTTGPDFDGDGIVDVSDPDDDNDGVLDSNDAFPRNASESVDTDADGIGNNADTDDDGDGVLDQDDAFPMDATESLDTDADGVGNNADTDDDGDGALDEEDAFPLDASESLDTDKDGIGNNTDTDDDGDGVLDQDDAFPLDPQESADADKDGVGDNSDRYPNDAACSLLDDGDGNACYLSLLKQDSQEPIIKADNGIIYFSLSSQAKVLRYDLATQAFLKPYRYNSDKVILDYVYHNQQQRLYLSYNDDSVSVVENDIEQDFPVQDQYSSKYLFSVDNYLGVSSGSRFTLYDANASLLSSAYTSGLIKQMSWDVSLSQITYVAGYDRLSQIGKLWLDKSSGEFTQHHNQSIYYSDNPVKAPYVESVDSSELIFASGHVYSSNNLSLKSDASAKFISGDVVADKGVVLASYNSGDTLLTNFDSSYKKVEVKSYTGSPVLAVELNGTVTLVTNTLSHYKISSYVPVADSDLDGIANESDAFPLDAAASIDSDSDGYPDAWNEGKSESDSTTSLFVDQFPQQASCWAAAHGNDSGDCDHSATMPNFIPERVLQTTDGQVLLFNKTLANIYRWSKASGQYLAPIKVGESNDLYQVLPTLFDYSPEQKRIYLAYKSSEITFIEQSKLELEQSFISSLEATNLLVATGKFIRTSYGIYDRNAVAVAGNSLYFSSDTEFTWSPDNNTLYFMRNQLYAEQVDQTSGLITASLRSGYLGSYMDATIIRVSTNGDILLGSGHIFSADTLRSKSYLDPFDDAVWLDNNQLVTVNKTTDSQFQLNRFNSEMQKLETTSFSGEFIRVLQMGGETYLLKRANDKLEFQLFVPNSDIDGDGVDNINDAFPLDAAASTDSDNDGYPDSWNDGYSAADSTTSLVLDQFPSDAACWSLSHSNGSGSCDYVATMPEFIPDMVTATDSGDILLLSKENRAVYRWSIDSEAYKDAILLRSRDESINTEPNVMTYSNTNQHLYFGYDAGKIMSIDLAKPHEMNQFARTERDVDGLSSVGNYVLAQDASGTLNTHFIFDHNGQRTDSRDWNEYSREYAWNEHNDRVYFLRDGRSPNGLHYEQIVQTTGLIGDADDAPYQSNTKIDLPIRVVNNGKHILLGSGQIYDANDMTLAHQLPQGIVDAVAFDDVFVAVRKVNDTSSELSIYNNSDFALADQQVYQSTVISLQRRHDVLVMVSLEDDKFVFSKLSFGDVDADGIPAWWENKYNLSDTDPSDALSDLDGDTLTNKTEYLIGTSPTSVDSDDDDLRDNEEVRLGTEPTLKDTDKDGLNDGDEINTYGTDPLLLDSDKDGFEDGEEVLKYQTNPADANSVPESISTLSESFENGVNTAIWSTPESSDANWTISLDRFNDGMQSIKSGTIANRQQSSVLYSGLFLAGQLTFDAYVSAESCCDVLLVYLNDELQHTIRNDDQWRSFSITLPQGENTIEWRYSKDSSSVDGDDAAWIDNVGFAATN